MYCVVVLVYRCRRYTFVDMSDMPSATASEGLTLDGEQTQLFTDRETLQGLVGINRDLAHLDRRQVR